MTDKNKPTPKPAQQLSEEETDKVVGGLMPRGGGGTGGTGAGLVSSDSCKETSDTGMMGCTG